MNTGALAIQTLREYIQKGHITGADESCLQPSSIDLPITNEIYRIRGSFLPRPNENIANLLATTAISDVLAPRTVLRRDDVYLCKLQTRLKLPPTVSGKVSSKSSTGRIDIRCRLIADGVSRYDEIPAGYEGDIWVEIVPKSFDIQLEAGIRLNQLRLFESYNALDKQAHIAAFEEHGFLRHRDGSRLGSDQRVTENGVLMTVDLSINEIVGYKAKRPWQHIELAKLDVKLDSSDFFEPIYRPTNGELVLKPGEFYLLGTKERIVIPPPFATEMVQYDATIGNLFTHFAGFFDPGFGWRKEGDSSIVGNVAVLEVEVHSTSIVIRDGQPICVMAYEHMQKIPDQLYGVDFGSNYGKQDLVKLAKWFKAIS